MRRRASAAAAILFALTAAGVHGQDSTASDDPRGALDSLRVQTVVDAERDFARTAAELGVRDAFLAFLADDAVVFTPRATNGPAYYANATTEAVLAWEPVLGETSSSDDLGYTTGPFAVLSAPGGSPVSGGWYFSVWRRDDEGVWQVVLDLGTPTPTAPAAGSSVTIPQRAPSAPGDAGDRHARLLRLDDLVAAAAQRRSTRRALAPVLGLDARHNDAGTIVEGGVRIARALADTPTAFHRLGDGVSRAGDLGYTYGEYTSGELPSLGQPTGNWLRIWRVGADGQWSIIQMVTAPIER